MSEQSEKKRGGRETKCTPAVRKQILLFVSKGSFLETACARAGVSSRQLREWMQRASKGEQPFAAFAAELDIAIAEPEGKVAGALLAQGAKDWRALAWWLEHGPAKKRWGYKAQIEMSGKVDGPLTKEAARKILEEKLGSRVLPAKANSVDVNAELASETDAQGDTGKPAA